ncbi:MAG: MATE family efflux transporter [Pseudomonadota bacterium]
MTASVLKPLSPYPVASIREAAFVSLPLMLASISGGLMYFIDRIVLAHYSLTAMNTVAAAGIVAWLFQYAIIGITSVSEVFVGRHNGAKRYHLLAEPIWQMIWFCAASTLLFIPMGQFAAPYLIPELYHEDGIPFFRLLMFTAPLFMTIPALAGFFIAQGKTRMVMYAAVLSNVLNIVLDFMLIFGVPALMIPEMGVHGAAIATVIAQSLNVAILFWCFLSAEMREKYGTGNVVWRPEVIKECLRVGVPTSVSHTLELLALSVQLHLLAHMGDDYVTVMTIGHTVYILLSFFTEGIQKGGMAIISNLIGAQAYKLISKCLLATMRLHLCIVCLAAIPLVIFPEQTLSLLVDFGEVPASPHLKEYLRYALILIWCYFLIDGLVWALWSVFTAAGDTIAAMFMNIPCIWLCTIVPIQYFVIEQQGSPHLIWLINLFYTTVLFGIYLLYYCCGRWRTHLSEENPILLLEDHSFAK